MFATAVWEVLREEFSDLPDQQQFLRLVFRLVAAVVLGGLLGYQREHESKPAGIRTHMLVALGAAVFVLVPQMGGMQSADLSRIIQGILTGIGFIGGGAILKLSKEKTVHGLTTAANLWVATGVGIAAGLGRLWSAALATLAAFLILSVVGSIEHRVEKKEAAKEAKEEVLTRV
jgi:putative Mg2+ transporter-C (MgtC) family protein